MALPAGRPGPADTGRRRPCRRRASAGSSICSSFQWLAGPGPTGPSCFGRVSCLGRLGDSRCSLSRFPSTRESGDRWRGETLAVSLPTAPASAPGRRSAAPPSVPSSWRRLAARSGHLISIPVTNTSVNPARRAGPALALLAGGHGQALGQLWLFWVAPPSRVAQGGEA